MSNFTLRSVVVIAQLLMLCACHSVNEVNNTPAKVGIENSQPVVSFTTTKTQRVKARNQGLPVLLSGRAAVYPSTLNAKTDGNGWVLVDIEVLPNGKVGKVTVLDQSNSAFNAAAVDSVKHWRFEASSEPADSRHIQQRIILIGAPGDHLQPSSSELQ